MMIEVLFTIGAMTSLGCGFNILAVKSSALHEFIWLLGGFGGAGMMIAAIAWGQP